MNTVGTEVNKTPKPGPLRDEFYSDNLLAGPGPLHPHPSFCLFQKVLAVPPSLHRRGGGNETSSGILHILHVPRTAELHLPSPGLRGAAWATLRFFQRASAPLHPCSLCRRALPLSGGVTSSEMPSLLHLVFYLAFCVRFIPTAIPRLVHPAEFRQCRSRVYTVNLHTPRGF